MHHQIRPGSYVRVRPNRSPKYGLGPVKMGEVGVVMDRVSRLEDGNKVAVLRVHFPSKKSWVGRREDLEIVRGFRAGDVVCVAPTTKRAGKLPGQPCLFKGRGNAQLGTRRITVAVLDREEAPHQPVNVVGFSSKPKDGEADDGSDDAARRALVGLAVQQMLREAGGEAGSEDSSSCAVM